MDRADGGEIGTAYRILTTAAHTSHFGSGGRIQAQWDGWGGRDKGSDKGSGVRPMPDLTEMVGQRGDVNLFGGAHQRQLVGRSTVR